MQKKCTNEVHFVHTYTCRPTCTWNHRQCCSQDQAIRDQDQDQDREVQDQDQKSETKTSNFRDQDQDQDQRLLNWH